VGSLPIKEFPIMFILPRLPYDYAALEPTLSADTLHTHHDKHHKIYVDKTNELARKAGLDSRSLEDVVREAHRRGDAKLFNNAAQAWNHAFFWECMTPEKAAPSEALLSAFRPAFGDLAKLKQTFVTEGADHFASGWVWIVTGSQGLQVVSTHDAEDILIREGLFPLLVCDLWEHAYYLDYKNERKAFLEHWFDQVANWAFAERQLAAADGKGEGFRYPAAVADDTASDRQSDSLAAQRPH
jgi:Fe-Mn family superoxide dismutase